MIEATKEQRQQLEKKLNKNKVDVEWYEEDKHSEHKYYTLSVAVGEDKDNLVALVLMLKQMVLPFKIIIKQFKYKENKKPNSRYSAFVEYTHKFEKGTQYNFKLKELITYYE